MIIKKAKLKTKSGDEAVFVLETGDGGVIELTAESIAEALGYVPADEADVEQLFKAIADLDETKQPIGDYALRSEIPSVPDSPVQSVNGKTGAVQLTAGDVGAVTQDYVDGEIADSKAQGVQQTPLFAESEKWLNDNGDTAKLYVLPDGMIYAYSEYENISAGGMPLFTNRADPDSSDWQTDKRFSSSSGSISSCTGAIVSNTIVAKKGDIIRVQGLQNGTTTATSSAYVGLMGYSDAAGATKLWSTPICFDKTKAQNAGGVKDIVTHEGDAVVYTAFKVVGGDGGITERENSESVVCIRVSGEPVTTVDDIIVTINEKIAYSEGGTESGYKWQSTGRAFIPADYEDRIIAVEQRSSSNSAKIAELEERVENGLSDVLTEKEKLQKIKEWDKPIYDSAPVTLLSDERNKPALSTSDKTIPAIYAKYRALMAAHPKYITETNLGLCTGSDTFTPFDMLRFDFKEPDGMTQPGMTASECHETKPKIIIMSGVHNEWAGVWGLYFALEEITTNPDFDDIRRNAHIIVIPCANPYGLVKPIGEYNTPSHVNANGVAIHNNFGVGWTQRGEVGDYNYSGTAPYSELETQYIDKVVADNSDAIAFLTCHNNDYSTYYGSHVIWASSATYYMCNVAYRLIDKITKAWYDKYGQTLKDAADEYKINMDADDYRLGRVTMSTSAGTEQLNATKYGIQATNLEIARMMYVFSGKTDCSAEVMTRGAEVYANFLRTVLAAYNYTDKEAQYK